jgi:hypothetical protein
MAIPRPPSPPTTWQVLVVEVLARPDCPDRAGAIGLAEAVCAEFGGAAVVQVFDIADQQAAQRARCLGSPSIRVDGCDVEPGAEQPGEGAYTYTCACRRYRGAQGLGGLPEARWIGQALRAAQARRALDELERELDVATAAAEAAAALDQVPLGGWLASKLNRLLLDFLMTEVVPQAARAADHSIDPTPLLASIADLLRLYADALERPNHGTD